MVRAGRPLAACAVILACVGSAPAPLAAQGGLLVQGILDGEAWSTDTLSTLLTRNRGRAAALARLQMWAAAEPWRGVVVYAQGEATEGAARTSAVPYGVVLDQLGVRYTRSSLIVVDVGKMPHIIGAFAPRRFSDRNPLIGGPDAYPVQYPVGVKLAGAARVIDYRVAVLSLPMSHRGYVPEPTASPRPAVGVGITPVVGLRIGGSATWGPYLNDRFTASQLNNSDWSRYRQRIVAADLSFSRGYLETHAEVAASRYEVPRRPDPIAGTAYFVEAKYTLAPRFFVAGRYERNDYPFITAAGPTNWVARATVFSNGEVGAGYRLTATTLLKASYRTDDWRVTAENYNFVRPGGRALAMQVSQSYDVMDWVDRRR